VPVAVPARESPIGKKPANRDAHERAVPEAIERFALDVGYDNSSPVS
jgi:hypothetical protein